ncbi:hypothetical protein ACRTAL_002277 [Clostridium perfringens]
MNKLTISQLEAFKRYPKFVKYHALQITPINKSKNDIKKYFKSKAIKLANEFDEIDLLTCDKKYLLDLCRRSSLLYFSFKYYRDSRKCNWEDIQECLIKLKDLLSK